MSLGAVAIKFLNIVSILYCSIVTNVNAVDSVEQVVTQHSQLLLKTIGNNFEVYNSISEGGSRLQTVLIYTHDDQSDEDCKGRTTKSKIRCSNEFVTLGDHCYYFSLTKATWNDALEVCTSLGSVLAHPNNSMENGLLINHLRNYHKGSSAWFIGGTDEEKEGEWVWAHNKSPIMFSDWWDNQPNNAGNNEHCAHYWENQAWKWNDTPCNNTVRYICQQ